MFASNRRCRLRKDAVEASSQAEMDELATSHFEALLGVPAPQDNDISLQEFHLSQVDLISLEASFFEDHVWAVIHGMQLDKVPGPDGFSIRFY